MPLLRAASWASRSFSNVKSCYTCMQLRASDPGIPSFFRDYDSSDANITWERMVVTGQILPLFRLHVDAPGLREFYFPSFIMPSILQWCLVLWIICTTSNFRCRSYGEKFGHSIVFPPFPPLLSCARQDIDILKDLCDAQTTNLPAQYRDTETTSKYYFPNRSIERRSEYSYKQGSKVCAAKLWRQPNRLTSSKALAVISLETRCW